MGDGSANPIVSYDPINDEFRIIAGNGGVIFNGIGVDDQLQDPYNPVFEPSGALLFIYNGARQIKRIPKDKLVGNLIKAKSWDDFDDDE